MTRDEYIESQLNEITKGLKKHGHMKAPDMFTGGTVMRILIDKIFGEIYDRYEAVGATHLCQPRADTDTAKQD